MNTQQRAITHSVLMTSAHSQGLHDADPLLGCRACELVLAGHAIQCDDCGAEVRVPGRCIECLFRAFAAL